MTKLPGRDLSRIDREKELTEPEMEVIAKDIVSILDQLWRIPQPPELEGQVMASASGHGLPHPAFFRQKIAGPYPSTSRLYDTLSVNRPELPPGTLEPIFADRIVWTHTDLTMRNVMIQNGRVSGVIDWEDSGWLPRHWILHNLRLLMKGAREHGPDTGYSPIDSLQQSRSHTMPPKQTEFLHGIFGNATA